MSRLLRVLISEDVDSKFADILSLLLEVLGEKIDYERASDLNATEDLVMEKSWDLVVLDLSMDIAATGSVDLSSGHATLAGLDVLERMKLFKMIVPTVLVTGFDSFQDPDRFDNAIMNLADVNDMASAWLPDSYLGCIRYGSEGWAAQLQVVLENWSRT